jgi:hypothetical protein
VARGVSLSTLQTRVLQRANLEGALTFITTSELTDHINESLAELYDLIRGVFGQDYYRSSFAITTVNGTSAYALPADFLALISVDVQVSGGPQNITLTAKPYMENERNLYKFLPATWTFGQPIYYRLQATNINFIPTPPGGWTVTLNYVPTPTKLANPGDTFDGVAGWEEYAVLDAAIKCLLKDGDLEMVAQLEQRKMAIRVRIEALAPERDAGQPERVHDVSTDEAQWWQGGGD